MSSPSSHYAAVVTFAEISIHSSLTQHLPQICTGVGWECCDLGKTTTHCNDCVTIAVIQSGPHTHTHVWTVGVECQISAGLTGGGCGAIPGGTRWSFSSCRGPMSARLPQRHVMVPWMFVRVSIKVCSIIIIIIHHTVHLFFTHFQALRSPEQQGN